MGWRSITTNYNLKTNFFGIYLENTSVTCAIITKQDRLKNTSARVTCSTRKGALFVGHLWILSHGAWKLADSWANDRQVGPAFSQG